MSAYETLLTEIQGPTLVITLNRPHVMNALNAKVLDELDHCIQAFHSNPALKGAILTGSGEKAFVAGADIAEIHVLENEEAALKVSQKGQRLFERIEEGGKPVIAAVNGFALGGGCELAMSCHMRIAAEHAKFGQPEVKLGLIAGYGGTQRLPRLIGRSKATELLLTGDMIAAGDALALGLVNHVVAQADLLNRAHEILNKIYLQSPLAVAYTLEAIHKGVLKPAKGFRTEADLFARAAASADGKEGTQAFLEKRKPAFRGE